MIKLPDNRCWNPITQKWEKCKQRGIAPPSSGGSGPPPQNSCFPEECCAGWNFLTEFKYCLMNLNVAFLNPGSALGVGGQCDNLVGALTWTQFWRAFDLVDTLGSPCKYHVQADGEILENGANFACYRTGTNFTNDAVPLVIGDTVIMCFELLPQTPECPTIQCCLELEVVAQTINGETNCFRRLNSVRYCTENFGTILTEEDYNDCVNCLGGSVITPPPCPPVEAVNFSTNPLTPTNINVPSGQYTVDYLFSFLIPDCCTEGGNWDLTYNLLTANFICTSVGNGNTTGVLSSPATFLIIGPVRAGTYCYILKTDIVCNNGAGPLTHFDIPVCLIIPDDLP